MLGISTDKPPKRDIYLRGRLFDEDSFTHHGKMNLNLVSGLLERFTAPGDLVLDPMGGAGSSLIGLLTGRRTAVGDIELQWARLLGRNLARCRQDLIGLATPGLACQWDAAKLPLAAGQTDFLLTSPPYFDTFSDWDASSNILEDRQNEHGLSYGAHPLQIANHHVYEEYLRAMRAVYAEAWRTLRPQAKMVLVIKDVMRGGRRVPVVEDNLSLALVCGFDLLQQGDIPVRGSRFTNVNRSKGQMAPSTETVLVLEKQVARRAKLRLALLELPLAHDGPGWVIASKAEKLARGRGFELWARSPGESEFHRMVGAIRRNGVSSRSRVKARIRKEKSFGMVRELVTKAGLVAGDEIAFYGSDVRYGRYVCRRLESLGCSVTSPLLGKNNGQRLAWLTREAVN
jgi:hypothetical protein